MVALRHIGFPVAFAVAATCGFCRGRILPCTEHPHSRPTTIDELKRERSGNEANSIYNFNSCSLFFIFLQGIMYIYIYISNGF